MRTSVLGPLAILMACSVVSCGAAPAAHVPPPVGSASSAAPAVPAKSVATPDAPFRATPPSADGTIQFVAPKITEARLKSGVRVLIVERHDLPVVSMRLVLPVGAGDVPDARPGVASFLGGMLEQGTKKHSALELSDAFEAIGAGHNAWVDWDSAGLAMRLLSERFDDGLDLLAEIALTPSFPEAEIERLRTRRLTSLQSDKSSPAAIAANAVAASLFGRSHPYGHNLVGEESDLRRITRAELASLHTRLFRPEGAAIIVAGDVIPSEVLPKLEARFGSWKPKGPKQLRTSPKTPSKSATGHRIVFSERGGAQSQVHVVRVGVPHSVKDRDAIIVANAILGGMFSSRVNMNLREKNAYTYGARSYFSMRHGAGPMQVAAAVIAQKTGPAIMEIFTELEGLQKSGPTDEELALAKESLRLAMPSRFEGVSDVASAVSELVVYDLPLDDYARRPSRIEAVTAADVMRVAKEYFSPEAMTVVVVGDRSTVLPQLEALGLGPIDERDAYGNPVATGKHP
jgi:zinc protease